MIRVAALATCQFAWGGLFDSRPAGREIHLVRMTVTAGFSGPTLCGVDRFAKDGPGFSMGGGVTGPGINAVPCPACEAVAGRDYLAAPIWGSTFAGLFRRHRKAPWSVRDLPVVAVEERK